MIFDDTRDNLTNTESQQQEADAYAETRESDPTWSEGCTEDIGEIARKHDEIVANARQESAEFLRNSRHIRLVDEPHEEYEDGANGYEDDPNFEEWQTYIEGMGW